MPFRYPRHPLQGHSDPFRDEQGKNRFADDAADPPGDLPPNPYGASEHAGGYQPAGYEPTARGRGAMLLSLGLGGCVSSCLAALGAILTLQSPAAVLGSVILLTAAALLLGAGACWSVWLMARADLRAYKAGAMEGESEGATRRAHRLAVAGGIIALLPMLILLAALAAAMFQDG